MKDAAFSPFDLGGDQFNVPPVRHLKPQGDGDQHLVGFLPPVGSQGQRIGERNTEFRVETLDQHREKIRVLKAAKSKRHLPQILVIIDDYADRWDIMHRAASILTTLFIRGRHMGCSCWISSQKLTAISSVARVNFRFLCVWRLRNQKEIYALLEELSALYPIPVLHQMYETALEDEPHSFWYINLVAKKKEDMFHIRFEHKMLWDQGGGAVGEEEG